MSSDPLLERLVDDLRPVRPLRLGPPLAIVGATVLAMAAVAALVLGVRGDLASLTVQPDLGLRLLAALACGALATAAVLQALRPEADPRRLLRLAAAVAAIALASGLAAAFAAPHADPLATRLDVRSGLHCLGWIVGLSLPCIGVLATILRRAAPTRPRAAALACALAAAAWSALAYSLYCPIDDPAYIAFWYGVSTLVVIGIGALALPRLLRW